MRLIGLVLLAMMVFSQGCDQTVVADDETDHGPELKNRLKFQLIQPADHETLITLPARVVAKPEHHFQLSSPAEGKVTALLVHEGVQVEPGTPLARLQIPSLTAWREMEEAARQQLQAATSRLTAEREKLAMGLGSKDAVQRAVSEEASSRMALAQVEAERKSGEDSGLRRRSNTSSIFTWQATKRGVITRLDISEGRSISSGHIAFSLVDPSHVNVMVRVPERFLTGMKEDTRLLWKPIGAPDDEEPMVLNYLRSAPVVDPTTGAVSCYFEGEPQTYGPSYFLPGRSGRGSLLAQAAPGTWRMARSAVCRMGGRDGVFVDTETGPEWLEVEVVGWRGDQILVQSSSLHERSSVVTHGVFLLKSIRLLKEES